MRIGFDARFLTHPQPGGFKTYSTNLAAALLQIDAKNEYIFYLDRTPNCPCLWEAHPNCQARIVPGDAPLLGMPWREQVGLARAVAQDKLDLFHAPCLTAPIRLGCPLVVTLHDMIWLNPPLAIAPTTKAQQKGIKRKFMDWYYRSIPQIAARRAAAVITVSEDAKQAIVAQLGLSPNHITVTPEASGKLFRRITDEAKLTAVQEKYRLGDDFILVIGSADPRKNVAGAIQAYSRLPLEVQERHPLVVVWTHAFLSDQMAELVQSLGVQSHTHFVQRVSDEELACLYNLAALFVFPSRYEGFGLPLLEAMSCGAPIVAANNSSIPEVAGDAAILVGAEDVAGMANAMHTVLTNEAQRLALIERGLARAQGFSWERCAQETIGVYAHAAQARS